MNKIDEIRQGEIYFNLHLRYHNDCPGAVETASNLYIL